VTAVYDTIGRGYAGQRRADPRVAAAIRAALGDARSVVNVGAGSGSYEPVDLSVLAVEPSREMIRQRPAGAAPAALAAGLARLADDLATGRWDARLGHLRAQRDADLGYRLVVVERAAGHGGYR
jgi:hypothetical protein